MVKGYLVEEQGKLSKKNIRLYLSAEFLWNVARTFPHAILTIFLMSLGVTLGKIALLQIFYMVASILMEFPSGVLSDHWSRKKVYIISTVFILISYALIYVSKGNFMVLSVAWTLYGVSAALRSGTLDNEIVLEIREQKLDLERFSVVETYLFSISFILGAFIGSILYERIYNGIYVITMLLFAGSLVISCFYISWIKNSHNPDIGKTGIIEETKKGLRLFVNERTLRMIVLLFTVLSLFVQPLYQFWQVLYNEKEIALIYFGYVYVILQVANMVGSALYKRIAYKYQYSYVLLILIPILFILEVIYFDSLAFFIGFPIVVTLFYMYYQFILVYMREQSPKEYISTFTSLIGTFTNISSIAVLGIMSILFRYMSIVYVYGIMFVVFAVISMVLLLKNYKKED